MAANRNPSDEARDRDDAEVDDSLDPDAPEQLAPDDKGDDGNILDDIILPDNPDAPVPF